MKNNNQSSPTNKIFLLDVAGSCNNDCLFCAVGGNHPEQDICAKKAIEIIDAQQLESGATIILSGGEPTTNLELFEILSHLKNKGYNAKMITNGRMLSSLSFSKKLVECGLMEILTEINSHVPELHDFLTQKQGSFRETVLGINNFVSAGGAVTVKIVLTRVNYKNLPKTVEFACKTMPALKGVILSSLNIQGNAIENKNLLGVRFSDTAPFVERAIDTANKFGMNIVLDIFPVCALSPPYQKYSLAREPHNIYKAGERRSIRNYIRHACRTCTLQHSCSGVYESHLNQFGKNEVTPMTDSVAS